VTARFKFDRFEVDAAQRRLTNGDEPVEVNSRYLDALILMLRHPGELITRDRFLDDVWKGIPVTDEALSQCITNLRRTLGDDAAKPRFIETVPKHGYRFIAAVEERQVQTLVGRHITFPRGWQGGISLTAACAIGGALAGVAGGFIYGLGASPDPLKPAVGAASFLMVMLAVNILAAAIGGLGIGFGMSAAHRIAGAKVLPTTIGAALGGLVIGAAVKMLGLDAFSVLLGKAPIAIGGGFEGFVLGGAVGLGSHLSLVRVRSWPSISGAALAGGVAGAVLPLLGGRLMGASLDSLADTFPASPLNIDGLGRWFGETHFGLTAQIGFGALEGFLFGTAITVAIRYANKLLREIEAV
jgi:DNA-binding winged helix-turn-helix (wHTH) protein